MERFHGQNGVVVVCQAHELLGIFPLSCVQNSGEPQGCSLHQSVIQDITGSRKHHHTCLPSTVGLLGCQFCWHLLGAHMPSSLSNSLPRDEYAPHQQQCAPVPNESTVATLPRQMGFSADGERWPRIHRATFPGVFFSLCMFQAAPCILASDYVVQGVE